MAFLSEIVKTRFGRRATKSLRRVAFGDLIDWSSPLRETLLYVELPFWLMLPPGEVRVTYRGVEFPISIR